MIASLRGTLIAVSLDYVVLETGGIGWQVFVPRSVLGSLGTTGAEIRLLTYLQVREDAMTLFGFSTSEQRELFEILLSVSGIGPKAALSLLGSASTDELRRAIAAGDVTRLSRAPGIGKKTAERLVLELKTKVGVKGGPLGSSSSPSPGNLSVNNDLVDMLLSLGFSATEANAAINSLPADAPPELEDRLRLALRYFGAP